MNEDTANVVIVAILFASIVALKVLKKKGLV